jgi:hypothetical protein
VELSDSFGCKSITDLSVTINPDPKITVNPSMVNYCDSIKCCWTVKYSGANTLSYEWYNPPSIKLLGVSNPFCKMLKAGESVIYRCRVKNEFGCTDSGNAYGSAPVHKLGVVLSGKRFCLNDIIQGKCQATALENMEWTVNGKLTTAAFSIVIKNVKSGWNYIKANQIAPCKGEWKDSFYVTIIRAAGILYNEIRIKVIDTVFFQDETIASPGTKLFRIWEFNDPQGDKCTTNIKKNLNPWRNCNYSLDALSRHYYHKKDCFTARL